MEVPPRQLGVGRVLPMYLSEASQGALEVLEVDSAIPIVVREMARPRTVPRTWTTAKASSGSAST